MCVTLLRFRIVIYEKLLFINFTYLYILCYEVFLFEIFHHVIKHIYITKTPVYFSCLAEVILCPH